MSEFVATCIALQQAKGPSRALDALVASTLNPDMPWRGRPLGTRHLTMAFTRGVENAERFILIALPGYDWSVGSDRKTGEYHAIIWSAKGNDDLAEGSTPALALLACAMVTAIEEGGWPTATHSKTELVQTGPASGIEARSAGTQSGPAVGESPARRAMPQPLTPSEGKTETPSADRVEAGGRP